MLLDVRTSPEYGAAHVEDSVNVNVTAGGFGERVRMIVPTGAELVLVAGTAEQVRAAIAALADDHRVLGTLAIEPERWREAGLVVRETPQIEPAALATRAEAEDSLQILDVREQQEWEQGHVPGAHFVPFHELAQRTNELDPRRAVAIYCATSQRSSIAASILERAGFRDIANVTGGITAWTAVGLPIERGL